MEQQTLGDRIRIQRAVNNWTQSDLANKLHTTQTSVGNWERGINKPSRYGLASIAHVLGVTVEYLEKGE